MESNFDFSDHIPPSDISESELVAPRKSMMWGLLLVGVLVGSTIPIAIRSFQSLPEQNLASERNLNSPASSAQEFRKNLTVRVKALLHNLQISDRSNDSEVASAPKAKKIKKHIAKSDSSEKQLVSPPEKPEKIVLASSEKSSPETQKAVAIVSPSTPAAVRPVVMQASATKKHRSGHKELEQAPVSAPSLPANPLAAAQKLEDKKPESYVQKAKDVPAAKRADAVLAAKTMIAEPSARLTVKSKSTDSYAQVMNNARYSKDKLSACPKRCVISVQDAHGNAVKALISGDLYASGLQKHNGTVNLSGQPKWVNNQQVFVVEQITFNLAPTLAKQVPSNSRFVPVVMRPKAAVRAARGADGELVPGMIIENRKQIPQDDDPEFDSSDTRLETMGE